MWQLSVNTRQYKSPMRPAVSLLVLLFSGVAVAQQPVATAEKTDGPSLSHTIDAVKMTAPPTIDGVINDDEWKGIPQMTGMVDANTGEVSPEPAIFYLGYDEKYIYFAAKLHDSDPNSIKMTEYRSNVTLNGDDNVQIDIDPYGSLTDWSHFTINPRGATQIQIAGGRAAKREWVGDFVAKARVTPDGWEAEARIPWALMKLPGSGKRQIRVDFDRYFARTSRVLDWTNTVGGDLRGVGKWENVDVPKIQEDRILQLLPYTYQGIDTDGTIANGGLDLKMPLTDQMTLVGTVNPDFRNIENQILSIDFSRFERLAGESRPFFQEGSQYYSSGIIATQRIHSFDSGLNLYGKINSKFAMGLVNTADFGHENDLMTTMQYNPDPTNTFRFSHTNLDSETAKNQAYLFAWGIQATKALNIFLRQEHTDDNSRGKGDERSIQANWQNGETFANVTTQSVSPKFHPGLGFFPEKDYKGVRGVVGWDHIIKDGPVNEVSLDTYANKFQHFGGGNYRRGMGGDILVGLKQGAAISGNVDFSQFEGSNDHTFTLDLQNPRSDPYRNFNVNYTWGEIESADYRNISFSTAYRPVNKLQLSLTSQFVHFNGDDKQIILGGSYDLGADRTISGRVVQGSHDVNAYVALQRAGGSGIEYFLILGDPNANKFRRSLILKATYPLQMFLGHHSK